MDHTNQTITATKKKKKKKFSARPNFLKIEPRSKITDLILKALYDLLFSIFFTIHRDDKILSPEISFYLLEIVLYDYYKCAAHNYVTYPKKSHFLWSFNRLLVAK